jgi:hypothetical protein
VKSGKFWVVGMLALGTALGVFSVVYWTRPENQVRGAFTQLHTALLRGPREKAVRLVADRASLDGKEMSRDEFLAAYKVESTAGLLEAAPCPSAPEHGEVRMKGRAWCFLRDSGRWKLHSVGPSPCACR